MTPDDLQELRERVQGLVDVYGVEADFAAFDAIMAELEHRGRMVEWLAAHTTSYWSFNGEFTDGKFGTLVRDKRLVLAREWAESQARNEGGGA